MRVKINLELGSVGPSFAGMSRFCCKSSQDVPGASANSSAFEGGSKNQPSRRRCIVQKFFQVLQGISKRLFQGCVNIERIASLQKINKMQLFYPISHNLGRVHSHVTLEPWPLTLGRVFAMYFCLPEDRTKSHFVSKIVGLCSVVCFTGFVFYFNHHLQHIQVGRAVRRQMHRIKTPNGLNHFSEKWKLILYLGRELQLPLHFIQRSIEPSSIFITSTLLGSS